MSSRFSRLAILALALAPFHHGSEVRGQTPGFEVVSVKANTSGDTRLSIATRGRVYTATNVPLRSVIAQAYNVAFEPFRLEGGPAWIRADRFDIVATLPEGASSRQTSMMLQALLAERFKLKVRTESREAPVFELVLARPDGRPGAGLRPTVFDCDSTGRARDGTPPPKVSDDARPTCGVDIGLNGGTIRAAGQSLEPLAGGLARFVDRRVIDKTGLTGRFDYELEFVVDARGAAQDTQANVPSIFTALQEQLGLKLESGRAPVEFVVIESVEKPSEN